MRHSAAAALFHMRILRIALAVAYPSSMTSDHQPRELIDCAAGDYLMRAALFRGSNLDLARVVGVFDSALRISRAKPLLGRPAVEGIATLPRQDRSNNDLHGGSFQQYPIAVRPIHRALLIICQIAQPVCELAHTTPNFSTATQQHELLSQESNLRVEY